MRNPNPNAQDDRGLECPTCGAVMRMIPAGISKRTGKPYRAFPVCENPPCKALKEQSRYNVPPSIQNPPMGQFQAPSAPPQSNSFDQNILNDLQVKLGEVNEVIANLRRWGIVMEKRMQGIESMAAFTESKIASELHSSFPPIEPKEPSKKFAFSQKDKDLLTDPMNIKIEMPEGLVDKNF